MFVPAETSNKNLSPQYAVRIRLTHRSALMLCCAAFATTLLFPLKASAQNTSDDDEIISVRTDLLLFPIRVRNKRGLGVEGLEQRDLVLKDKDQVTAGLYFARGADRVSMVFALDQSGSLREIISQQRDAALALFSRFGDRSSVAVIRFADSPSVVVPFGRDSEAVRGAFSFGSGANRRTAIFDAAESALKLFDELPPVRAERHIVVLISDGLDNASRTKSKAVIDAALDRRVSFYVIHLPLFQPGENGLQVRPPSKGFRELAQETGGKYFLVGGDSKFALTPNKTTDLTPVFQAIEEDLRSQYLLGFYLNETARDGRRHRFSLGFASPGVEYSVGRFGYSRTHDFFINLPAGAKKLPS